MTTMRITIRNGQLVDPVAGRDFTADLHLAEGRIAAVGRAPDGYRADREIDATGCAVAPGLIDLSVRLREPGFEYRATLESELGAAAAGGITSLACPPDTDPVLDEPGLVEMLKRRAASLALSRVHPVGALTQGLGGQRLAELNELTEAGCVAFSQVDRPFADLGVTYRAFQYAATFGFPVWMHPLDRGLAAGGVAHDGEVATRLGLPGIPALAETVAVAALLLLAKETGARLHLCRLSTADAVDMIRRAKADGIAVTCDVTSHHVHLTEMDIGYFDAHYRLTPPLRSMRDRDALSHGLADGTIDAMCSDHTPVDEDGKSVPFAEAEPGASGVETLLPLTLRWGAGQRSLAAALRPVTVGPASVLGLVAPSLAPGAVADLCVFDPRELRRIQPAGLFSQGKNTPFSGYELAGRVRYTLIDGRIVFEA